MRKNIMKDFLKMEKIRTGDCFDLKITEAIEDIKIEKSRDWSQRDFWDGDWFIKIKMGKSIGLTRQDSLIGEKAEWWDNGVIFKNLSWFEVKEAKRLVWQAFTRLKNDIEKNQQFINKFGDILPESMSDIHSAIYNKPSKTVEEVLNEIPTKYISTANYCNIHSYSEYYLSNGNNSSTKLVVEYETEEYDGSSRSYKHTNKKLKEYIDKGYSFLIEIKHGATVKNHVSYGCDVNIYKI